MADNVQPDLEAQGEGNGANHPYDDPTTTLIHRDALGRRKPVSHKAGSLHGYYLNPDDAKLAELQKVQEVAPMRSKLPWALQVSASGYESDGKGALSIRANQYALACLALPVLFFTFADFETPVRNGGYYDRVLYRDWYSVDVAKNASEAASCRGEHARERVTNTSRIDPGVEMKSSGTAQSKTSDLQTRLLGPKRLCFVNEAPSEEAYAEYRPLEVTEWQRRHPKAGYPSFLFVSYTSHQFPTQGKATLESDFGVKYTPAEREDRLREMSKNRRALAKLAAEVARKTDLDAFWIDFESGIDHTGSVDGDDPGAYAICDILRASESMIIVVGPAYHFTRIGSGTPNSVEVKYGEWLESWGERLWTLPELLFCPNSDGVPVHTLDNQPPAILSKHSIARTLKDGESVRELIEHYSGTIQLTPLELTVTATQCLFARPHNQFSPGDASYALMGLMRRRPKVNKHDSAFKAFARLSFLNDNDRLLERLICLQPDLSKRQSWSSLYDAYQASLWDIEPCTQVAGIVNAQPARDPNRRPQEDKLAAALDETQIIVLDGAFGAAIKWECLQPVAFMKRASFLQVLARFLVRGFSVWFFYGLILTIAGGAMNSYSHGTGSAMLAAGLPIFIPALIAWPFLPTMVRRLYAGKLWATQAAFFGVNGIPELSEVERCIFGFNQDRLTWSTHGSTLSDAKIDDRTGELLPQKPVVDRDSKAAGLKVFTLVDTFTMTATAFQAERLPVAAVICGQEGGMQRALLCSYDPVSRAFCKETVLRMKTTCLERMPRMDRFRFAMRRE